MSGCARSDARSRRPRPSRSGWSRPTKRDLPGPEVTRWLGRVLPGERVTAAVPLTGGYSNSNTRLVTAAGRSYVLRRYLPAQGGPVRDVAAAGRTCAVEAAVAGRLRGVAPV